MSLAIVVITMNRRAELERTLGAIAALPRPPRVVVVDNGSTDGTAQFLASNPDVDEVLLSTNLGGAARNIGVAVAGTELVAFLDDDTWPEPDALERAAVYLGAHPDVAVVAAHVLVGPEQRVDPVSSAMAASPLGELDGGMLVAGFLAGGSIVRSEPFLAVGGFHERFGVGGEEELVAWDLLDRGWLLVYVPEVVVHHHPSLQRDPRARRIRERRNRLWAAGLRRPAGEVLRQLREELVNTPTAAERSRLLTGLLRGASFVAKSRRVLGPAALDVIRSVERA